ncbi:MAG: tRNA-guanine transglycosylase, partial [Clostridia bacterium]|nr:tRNA-guanine transglycosylase [Clostridia bacterium]
PVDPECGCPVCQKFSRAYLRHLLKADEVLGLRLCVAHNLWFYNNLMAEIRLAIEEGRYDEFRQQWSERLDRRI